MLLLLILHLPLPFNKEKHYTLFFRSHKTLYHLNLILFLIHQPQHTVILVWLFLDYTALLDILTV
jgi:hypothetical protein